MKVLSKAGYLCAKSPLLESCVAWVGHRFPQQRIVSSLCYHTGEQALQDSGRNRNRLASLRNGARLEGSLDEHLFRDIYFHGVFEPDMTRIVTQLTKPGQTWLDVGANIGYYTILLASLVGESGRVHAVEPNPPFADQLERSLQKNGMKNVTLTRAAVSDSAGQEVTLYVPFDVRSTPGGGGRSSLLVQQDIPNVHKVIVKTIALDDYLDREKSQPDYMKIDVEGAEILAFRGMERHLRQHPPKVIFCEVNGCIQSIASPEELIRHLEERGYIPYSVESAGLRRYVADGSFDLNQVNNFAFCHETAIKQLNPEVFRNDA